MKYRETTITQPSKVIEAKLLYQYIVIFEKYKSNKISLEKKISIGKSSLYVLPFSS